MRLKSEPHSAQQQQQSWSVDLLNAKAHNKPTGGTEIGLAKSGGLLETTGGNSAGSIWVSRGSSINTQNTRSLHSKRSIEETGKTFLRTSCLGPQEREYNFKATADTELLQVQEIA